jgi:hypothetical protein
MTGHDEISAMKQIADALEPLDDAGRARALQWAVSRFRAGGTSHATLQDHPPSPAGGSANSRFASFADLFEATHPSTDREKALVASYWVQVSQSQPSFGSQTLNDALKDLGHGVGNITDALSALKDEKPALVLQLKKSGTSKQARKTYKLTQEGIRRVHGMIPGDASLMAAE